MHGSLHIALVIIANILILVLTVWLYMRLLHDPKVDSDIAETALDLLSKRFERGEINREEFEALKKKLAG